MSSKPQELDAVKNLRIILNLESGRIFFKHLLREFDVLGTPPAHLSNDELREEIAYRRYGASIIDYLTKADPLVLGQLVAELSREKHNEYVNEDESITQTEPDFG